MQHTQKIYETGYKSLCVPRLRLMETFWQRWFWMTSYETLLPRWRISRWWSEPSARPSGCRTTRPWRMCSRGSNKWRSVVIAQGLRIHSFVDFCIILPGAIKLIGTELEGCFYSQICYILIFKLHRISCLLMFCFVKLDFLSAFISIFQVFCFLHKINFVKFIMCLDCEIWRINFLIIKLFFTKKKKKLVFWKTHLSKKLLVFKQSVLSW